MVNDCGFYCAVETDILLYRGRYNALEIPVAGTQSDRGHVHHGRVRHGRPSGTDLGTLSCTFFRQQGLVEVFLCYLKTWISARIQSKSKPTLSFTLPVALRGGVEILVVFVG
jgi:hypothetical protein